ncbi:MAG TPA: hypothetical protein VML91_08420 [Burkholderiales bacterium]|nr:hypothetical protein [Burkholderiales bacterium]
MRAFLWLQPAIVCGLLAGVAPDLAAQDKLPQAMSGKWNGISRQGQAGQTTFGGTWSVVIDKQNPDGTIEGKATWVGARYCTMENEPFTGKFDGTRLTIVAQFRNKIPNGGCDLKANMVLKKTAGAKEFEGTIPNSRDQYRLTLGPS